LLDEPLSALYSALRERLVTELHDILRDAGNTALYDTHDHDEAFTVADRVEVMRTGPNVQSGPPGELWDDPVDGEAARCLGCGGGQRQERTLAISPHSLTLVSFVADDGDAHLAPDAHLLQGTVVSVGFTRGRTTARVTIPGWGEQTATTDGLEGVQTGQEVQVQVEPSGVVELQCS